MELRDEVAKVVYKKHFSFLNGNWAGDAKTCSFALVYRFDMKLEEAQKIVRYWNTYGGV